MCKQVWSLIVLCVLVIVSVSGTAIPASAATPAPTPLPPPTPIATEVRPADGAVMVYVPAGEFLMGSPESQGDYGEHPQHTVHLNAFWIDQTEVTNCQFEAFVEATGYRTDAEKEGDGALYIGGGSFLTIEGADWRHPERPDSDIAERMALPVVQVSWNDAQAYCKWAGARLPTEAEWEKACRGMDGRRYPWGDQKSNCEYAVIHDFNLGLACGRGEPWPAGSKPAGASPYGALDMAGNVWEWVSDWYDARYYAHSPASNPQGPDEGTDRTDRGGSWVNRYVASGGSDISLRCATRGGFVPPTNRTNIGGFRCAVADSDLAAQATSPTSSVLFIGDVDSSSLDYYFPMLAASCDQPIKIESQRFTVDLYSLKDQWRRGAIGPKPGSVVKEIRTGKWDVVVLSQDMTGYIDQTEDFYEYAGKFNEEIKQSGAETVLNMTEGSDPSVTTDDIAAIYSQAGADLGVKVAPVALAFQRSLQERPDLDVYDENGRPTEHGYYLMMCVLYATIFDQNPDSLSYRMASAELPPEGVFFWEEEISEEDATFLRQVAWETVTEYRAQQGTQ